MIIADLKIHRFPVAHAVNWIFVRLTTDDGIVGWGEATLEGQDDSAIAAIGECFRSLAGADPRRIEWLWNHWRKVPWRGSALYTAMSALEQALWDITGKAAGLPVHELLGGRVRDAVRVYTWVANSGTAPPGQIAEQVHEAREAYGYTVFKCAPLQSHYTLNREQIRRTRTIAEVISTAAGEDGRFCLDGAGSLYAPAAVDLARALVDLQPLFLEELVNCDDLDGLRRLSEACPGAPLAAGEKAFTRWDVWPLLSERLLSYLQVDVCHTGGMLELRKIAAMAEAASVPVIPHNPNGPIGTAAVLQVAASAPNLVQLETVRNRIELMDSLVEETIEVVDGAMRVPTGPGLGVTMNEEALRGHEVVSLDLPLRLAATVPMDLL